MQLQQSFPDNISAIYFIANSPLSLYRMMRENYFVQNEIASLPSEELISEFKKRAIDTKAKTSKDIAELYAIFIALTFKEEEIVKAFFETSSKINFEWFSQIALFYLNNRQPTPSYQVMQIPITQESEVHEIEPTTNDIDYQNNQYAL